MGRMSKHEQGIIVETFYGIDPKTFEVERVSLTKGGVLRKYNRDMHVYEHPVLHGRLPKNEIIIVWHLTDIISFREGIFSEEQKKESIGKLEAKAAGMKQAAEKQGTPT